MKPSGDNESPNIYESFLQTEYKWKSGHRAQEKAIRTKLIYFVYTNKISIPTAHIKKLRLLFD